VTHPSGAALPGSPRQEPALLSIGSVDASQLLLIDLDLSECFADAFNLDQLRFEGSQCRFALCCIRKRGPATSPGSSPFVRTRSRRT